MTIPGALIKQVCDILHQGGVILTPTDTVWGLSCDATNAEAIKKINQLKQRPVGKSFIVLVDADYKLETYVQEVPDVAYDLIEYNETPLTMVFPKGKNLPSETINDDGSIAIRVVKENDFIIHLLERFKKPLVSTSANISGEAPAKSLNEINPELQQKVDYIVPEEFGKDQTGRPSTIMSLGPDGLFKFIRR